MTTDALTRRAFGKLFLGTAAGSAMLELGRAQLHATPVAGYKAMVGIFLYGGNDGWNMIVPTDKRYATYALLRAGLAHSADSLVPMAGSSYGMHPALAPLRSAWDAGALNVVLNTGTLHVPLTKAQFTNNPELRPSNLMSHTDEQYHWQGMRAREDSSDGFMGRIIDRSADTAIPSLVSFGGSDVILAGAKGQSLVMPSAGVIAQAGADANSADPVVFARNAAVSALASNAGLGAVADTTATQISQGYQQSGTANGVLTAANSAVDKYFVDANGNRLNSDVSRQLLRVARMIEARNTLGHSRQTFFVNHGGYDTHGDQLGIQGNLLTDLANAMAGFYNAMKALGLSENVVAYTMSDFGRVYQGNGTGGSDHAWGNIHMVLGGPLKGKQVIGAYPSLVLGGDDDGYGDGRWIPTISSTEYVSSIARWHGVADADMSYVFPYWSTWSTNGRGPIELFKS